MVVKNVTNDQLEGVVKKINPDKEMELFNSGTQLNLTGGAYPMLQFKYAKDRNNPPKFIIKVLFDEKDKIVTVLPLKR